MGNDTVEGAWLVGYNLSFVGNFSSGQCKIGLNHVVCEVFTIQGQVRIVKNSQFCDCVTFDMDKRNVACNKMWDVILCANILIGNSLYGAISLLVGMRSCATLWRRGRVRPQ